MSDILKIKNNLVSTDLNNYSPKVVQNNFNNIKNVTNIISEEVELISVPLNYQNIISDGYTPQGISKIDGQIFISAYKIGERSRIYIYDDTTNAYKGVLVLNNSAHVGGISYDQENDIIFVTGSNGKVNTYSYEKIKRVINNKFIKNNNNAFTIIFSDNENSAYYFQIDNDININFIEGMDSKAATVYYYDDRVYVGSFEGITSGILVSYELSYDKEKNTISTSDIKCGLLPSSTQGIAITKYKDSDYLITAQSISSSKSTITVFKREDSRYKVGRIYLDDIGLEGIDVDEKGEVIAVFENGRNEVLSTNVEDLEKQFDSYSIVDEFMQDVMGLGYEAKQKFNELMSKF